jgi:hypothetical protein
MEAGSVGGVLLMLLVLAEQNSFEGSGFSWEQD